MTRRRRRTTTGVLVAQWTLGTLCALFSVGSASAQTVCDRTCLRTLLDQYLAAVVKHDPKAVPLVVGFRQTENAINVSAGRRRLEDRHGPRQNAAPVHRRGQRSGGLLRSHRRGRQRRAGDRAAARRESQADRGRVVSGPRQRSRVERSAAARSSAGQPAESRVRDRQSSAGPRGAEGAASVARRARGGRQQLLRRHHLARRLGRADASRMRSRGKRIARAGRPLPSARRARRGAGAPPAPRRMRPRTTACPASRISISRWWSRGGSRWSIRKRRWRSAWPCSSGVPARPRRATSSVSGSTSKTAESAPSTRRCSTQGRSLPCRTGRRTPETGHCPRPSCRRPRPQGPDRC